MKLSLESRARKERFRQVAPAAVIESASLPIEQVTRSFPPAPRLHHKVGHFLLVAKSALVADNARRGL